MKLYDYIVQKYRFGQKTKNKFLFQYIQGIKVAPNNVISMSTAYAWVLDEMKSTNR